ncbi:neutral protease 2 [Favolaschia claudopus]|uniref:Neutral protease 2 n=1 Tax=Favolaschia claudopus TaxID=2862362 RepID=A0AAW0A7S3_9AGAR
MGGKSRQIGTAETQPLAGLLNTPAQSIFSSLTAVALGLSAGDLRVSLKPISKSANSIDDIVLTAVVPNPTDHDIRVIGKNNVLDNSTTSSFAVSKDDNTVLFTTGIRTTLDLSAEGVYVTIPAGSSIAVNHTRLGPLFDFNTHGTGKFKFAPKTVFQTGYDADPLQVEVDAVEVNVAHDVAKREVFPLERRASTPTCGNSARLTVLKNALSDARVRAGGAASDINTHPNSAEFKTYFGGNKQADIWYNFDRIAGDLASSGTRKIYCNKDHASLCGGSGGVIAGGKIVGSDHWLTRLPKRLIYTCDYLFNNVGSTAGVCSGGFDSTASSKGGVILHELSHATAGTADIAYGCSATAKLSAATGFE